MAYEYTWYGDAELDTAALREFIAGATGGEQHSDGTVFLAGMYVSAWQESADEANPAVRLFGFSNAFTAIFRISSQDGAEHNVAVMVHTLVAFSQRRHSNGVLLFNGDTAVLRYGPDGVVFDSEWEDWAENGEVAPLLTKFGSGALPQPLL